MKLSIIIPAYNESGKIAKDIEFACRFFQKNNLQGEIIISDDGSTDSTADQADKAGRIFCGKISFLVIRNPQHRGKGFAVRQGIMKACGDYIMFADSGECVPFDNILRGLNMLTSGQYQIAHGSRNLAKENIKVDHNIYRHIFSELFHFFVVKMMKIPVELTDTQCGFKIYRGDIAHLLYEQSKTDGFMFDIEIIRRALKQHCTIAEFPVDWSCDPDSRLSPAKHFWEILSELITIRRIT